MTNNQKQLDTPNNQSQNSEVVLNMDTKPDVSHEILAKWQKIVDLLAHTIGVPAGLVMRVHPEEIEVFVSSKTENNPYTVGAKEHLNSGLYCETVMEERGNLLVPNALEDPEWDSNPDIPLNMISYLGFPLIWPDNKVFGTVCVLDNKTNAYSSEYIALVQQFSEIINDDLELLIERARRQQAEEKLNERNKLFKLAFDSSPDAINLNRFSDGLYLDVNNGFCDIMGYEYEDVVGKTSLELDIWVRSEDRQKLIDYLRRDGFVNNLEINFVRKDGEIVIGSMSARVLSYAGEDVILSTTRDITKYKRALDDLRHSEQKYRLLAENARDLIYSIRLKPEMRFEYVSPSVTKMIGYTPEEHYADPQLGFRLIHPEDQHLLSNVLERNPNDPLVFRWIHKDGSVIWTEQNNTLILDTEGEVVAIEGIARDITERKQYEMALHESSLRYQSLFEQSNDAIYLVTLEGIYLDANQRALDMLGYTLDELKAIHQPNIVVPDERADSANVLQKLLAGKELPPYQRTLLRKDGSTFVSEINVGLIYDENGRPLYVQSIVRDITERVQMQQSLLDSEERYRLLSDLTFEGVTLHHEGVIQDTNSAMLKMFGYERDEIIGQQVIDLLFTPESRIIIRESIRKHYAHPYEVTGVRKDGHHFPVELEARQIGPRLRVASVRDITTRKQAEQALREAEERYRTVADFSTDWTYWQKPDGSIQYVSPACEAITGYTPEEIRANPRLIQQQIIEEDLPIWNQHRHASISSNTIQRIQFRIQHRNGSIRWIEHSCRPVYDTAEQFNGYRVNNSDITERKQAAQLELNIERLKASFQREQAKNELIQRVISMLSHDLRTPLAVIASSRDILSRYFERLSDQKRQEKLDMIGRQIQFALEILEDTVQIARGNLSERQFNPVKTNLAMLCQVSVDEIREAQDGEHNIYFINEGAVETVSVDEVLVSRILLNLLSNAIKYSPNGGEIRLELDLSDTWLILRVIDQGMGISEDDLPSIFEPFYRSNEVYTINGTGLGLNIVKDCVNRHEGRIHVNSKLGVGSTFTVELPIQPKNSTA